MDKLETYHQIDALTEKDEKIENLEAILNVSDSLLGENLKLIKEQEETNIELKAELKTLKNQYQKVVEQNKSLQKELKELKTKTYQTLGE